MTKTTICTRCGWDCSLEYQLPDKIEGWPSDLPCPPLPPEFVINHPEVCPSPFEVGEKLYWDLDGEDPHGPPLLVRFKKLEEIASGDFTLKEGKWVRISEPSAYLAVVRAEPEGIQPSHEETYGEVLMQDMIVMISGLTAASRWPALEIESA